MRKFVMSLTDTKLKNIAETTANARLRAEANREITRRAEVQKATKPVKASKEEIEKLAPKKTTRKAKKDVDTSSEDSVESND